MVQLKLHVHIVLETAKEERLRGRAERSEIENAREGERGRYQEISIERGGGEKVIHLLF